MVTVGISTNTRLLSIAILSQMKLIGYETHLYKSAWSPVKRDKIIASLEPCVRQYCIQGVFLSIPHPSHQTAALKELVDCITTYFQQHNIPIAVKTPEVFAPLCLPYTRKRRKVLMKAVVVRFPELERLYLKELRNKVKYYFKLFEAVAVAMLAEEGVK